MNNRPSFIPATWKNGKSQPSVFVHAWPYFPAGENMDPVGWVARYENGHSKVTIPFFTPDSGKGRFKPGAGVVPRMLFGLETLNRPGYLFITEGEKDASALHALGLCAISSPGGSKAASKCDWGPVIDAAERSRHVLIWPDNDEPGESYARDVAACLSWNCLYLAAPPEGTPKTSGAGAADWLQAKIKPLNEGGAWDGLTTPEISPKELNYLKKSLIESAREHAKIPPDHWKKSSPDRPRKKAARHEAPPYVETESGIFKVSAENERQLANFTAHIAEEVMRDDGMDQSLTITIEGQRAGKLLPPVNLTFEQFSAMVWPMKHWGTACMVSPGQSSKDHLRHAIQWLSQHGREAPRKTVFLQTGWRKIENEWMYLNGGAVISKDGEVSHIQVDIGELSELYSLPAPSETPEQCSQAALASYNASQVAPPEVSIPLIACVYLAPIAQAMAVDFALWLEGPSRSMKSTVAALMAAHFGAGIDRTTLTASWLDTGNAIGYKLFTLSDSLAILDDYAPQPSTSDQARLDKSVHQVIRSIGNRAGRSRLTADIKMQKQRPPRALTIATAEQWPSGESINARLYGVPIQPGDLDINRLNHSQSDAKDGLLSRAMADHIQHLAGDYERHIDAQRNYMHQQRSKALAKGLNGRTPEQIAFLMTGYMEAVRGWVRHSIITAQQAGAFEENAWSILLELAKQHERRIQTTQPAVAFRAALIDLLASNSVHLCGKDYREPPQSTQYGWVNGEPSGQLIGWASSSEVFLLPTPSLEAVSHSLAKIGMPLNIRPQALWRQMRDRGYLKSGNTESNHERSTIRTTRTVKIQGESVRVLVMPLEVITPDVNERKAK